ncbi:unnamed protein product [Caenorhabditis angaria]|uniref:FBA domain-containing protein n=1 Tax=Caenorhabditis angaria TaxID=860376 RepID=A0A9P1J056_9PELO|nr:unnamed protein product [Caenorhabditis angaria]
MTLGKILPSQKWLDAANSNKFENSELAVEDSANFKFNLENLEASEKGYNIYSPFKIHQGMTFQEHAEKYNFRYDLWEEDFGIAIENNCTKCEPDDSVENCFAFSFREQEILIDIDLVDFGIEPWILDHVRPKIRVTQKANHHTDSGAILALAVQMGRCEKPPHRVYLHEDALDVAEDRTLGVCRREWEIGSAAKWEDMIVELSDYPSRMRHLTIIIAGKDKPYWRGFFGPKIANLQFQVILPEEPVLYKLREPLDCEERADEKTEEEELARRKIQLLADYSKKLCDSFT